MSAKLELKIDKVIEDISEVKETIVEVKENVVKNTADLEHHIARTEANEELIALYRKSQEDHESAVAEELEGLKKHVAFVKGASWALGVVGAIIVALQSMGILTKLFA